MSVDDVPRTEAELQSAMGRLLREAYSNGLEVEGGWECRNGGGHPDWDVVVTEVQK